MVGKVSGRDGCEKQYYKNYKITKLHPVFLFYLNFPFCMGCGANVWVMRCM